MPVSPNRVESVAVGADDVALSVLGAAGERVEMVGTSAVLPLGVSKLREMLLAGPTPS